MKRVVVFVLILLLSILTVSAVENPYKFTGKPLDQESGLYYYGARYYNPSIGRFTTPDVLRGDLSNPLSLNRYTYVRNNPLRYIDPTGNAIALYEDTESIYSGKDVINDLTHIAGLKEGDITTKTTDIGQELVLNIAEGDYEGDSPLVFGLLKDAIDNPGLLALVKSDFYGGFGIFQTDEEGLGRESEQGIVGMLLYGALKQEKPYGENFEQITLDTGDMLIEILAIFNLIVGEKGIVVKGNSESGAKMGGSGNPIIDLLDIDNEYRLRHGLKKREHYNVNEEELSTSL